MLETANSGLLSSLSDKVSALLFARALKRIDAVPSLAEAYKLNSDIEQFLVAHSGRMSDKALGEIISHNQFEKPGVGETEAKRRNVYDSQNESIFEDSRPILKQNYEGQEGEKPKRGLASAGANRVKS